MKEIEIPEGYEARIERNKIIIELKESEDERIRKEIIDYLNFAESHNLLRVADYKKKKGWLTYLERQKEQKPAEQLGGTFTSYDMAKTFMEGQNYVIAHPEKFGLCKPAEWSEEDEKMFIGVIDTVKDAIAECDCDDVGARAMFIYEKELNWLENRFKSLRPQPKVELTLLDKNIIEAAVAFVEQNDHFNCYGGIDKHTVIKALRSLKPSWKPSEEQMKILRKYVLGEWRDLTIGQDRILTSLYNDLKKL